MTQRADATAMATPTRSDTIRAAAVTASEIFCVLGTLVGVGVLGTRVEESSGGRLAADATLIAPATPAFSIWSVIYLGLAAYTVLQWLPDRRATARIRATGWLAAASMILNAAWLLVTQQGWLEVSVVVMLALLVTLGALVQRLHDDPAPTVTDRIVVDATFGLYLGWVCVATCANIAATLVGRGVAAQGTGPTIATVAVLAAVVGIGTFLAQRLPGWWPLVAGVVWGLAWVAVARATDEPRSTPVAVAAALAVVLIVAAFIRTRRAGARPSLSASA